MPKIDAKNGKTQYLVEITTPGGNTLVADEPLDKGGQDAGFAPKELLASALAACTNITVRMFAERKGWDLQNAGISVELMEENGLTTFKRNIQFEGNLDDSQKTLLLKVANACPVHKILTNKVEIETTLAKH